MPTLHEKMTQDLDLAGYAPRTKQAYLASVRDLEAFLGCPLAELTNDQLREWVCHLLGLGRSPQRLRQHFAALKFLYARTLGRPSAIAFLSWPAARERMPVILSPSEVVALLDCRVVDFVDMIDRALTLMDSPGVRAELSARLELSVVDEFQDTSPLQLALFVRLHELAGRSTWVGDRKQCIFEYAGADPTLMEAVTNWARDSGATVDRLPNNWRSRPELVAAFSRLFAAAFSRHGYPASEVQMDAKRIAPAKLETLPPFGLWSLGTKNLEEDLEAIAGGVRRLVDRPDETPVLDPVTKEVRGLQAGDVCVLVATNAEAETLAIALANRGVRAAIARAGLLSTPEGVLATAGLRYLLDRRDSLSAAQIDALTGFGEQTPDAWLSQLVGANLERQAAIERGEEPAVPGKSAQVARLDHLKAEVDTLGPSEILDRVLSVLTLADYCARWPDPEQRLGNIDALRALAAEYEEWCARQREAATLAGLLRFLAQSSQKVLVRDEELASDNQHVTAGRQTVTIATYHRSKGLEWPVVVLGSLGREGRRDAFEVSPETERAEFDPRDPLGNRWIRYWPWPYGAQRKTGLWDTVAASPEGMAVAAREERERVRLLYVGFTRARDHLILAARMGKQGLKTAWLDELCDHHEKPLIEVVRDGLSGEEVQVAIRSIDGSVERWPARQWMLPDPGAVPRIASNDTHHWIVTPASERSVRVPYWIAPSRAGADWPELRPLTVKDVISTDSRLPLGSHRDVDWDVVGNALHAFLAADVPDLEPAQRLEIAQRLLVASGLGTMLSPASLLRSGDSLRTWIASRWPDARWRREISVDAVIGTSGGTRRIRGSIDLLLETSVGCVIIDHKTYPGAMNTWRERAATFGPQLAAYAEALRATGRTVAEHWVSFAIAGGIVRLE
jgi:ATP-dependent exoDNAse (exonuclease V) beta subunit